MRKIKIYYYMLMLAILIHVYLVIVIVKHDYDLINLWNRLYLPLLFSAISFLFTYIINIQGGGKSSKYLIYFLLSGSTTFLASSESGLENIVAKILLSITLPLTAYFFRRFIFETLLNKRIIKRQEVMIGTFSLFALLLVIVLNTLREFVDNGIFDYFSRTVFILYFILHISLPMVKITQLLIKKNHAQRTFLLWMLLVPMLAFSPFIFLHALPSLLGEPSTDPYFTAIAFLAIPVGYTYLILTKELLTLRFVYNRIVYYSGLAIIPTVLISFMLVYIIAELSVANLLMVFSVLYITNIVFLFLKEKLDFRLRYNLFQDTNNTVQFIERVYKDLSKIKTKKKLDKYIVKEIKEQLNNVHVTIFTYNYETTQIEKGNWSVPTVWNDSSLKKVVLNNEDTTFIRHYNSIGIFLFRCQNIAHYLWVEKTTDYSRFILREKTWLIIFASYVRLVYENIIMNENYVKKLIDNTEQSSISQSRFLFHMAEQERKRLATDIHDTLLQELIFIYRNLTELSVNNYPELREMEIALKKVIEKTRQTCSEIIPNTLSNQGLSAALKERMNLSRIRSNFHLTYEIDVINESDIDDEKSLVIYRVVEELLNNAERHSYANRVSIYVWESEEKIYIDYLDDGVGFLNQEKQITGQIGLRGMVERVKSIDGEIEFETEEYVKIYITIPG